MCALIRYIISDHVEMLHNNDTFRLFVVSSNLWVMYSVLYNFIISITPFMIQTPTKLVLMHVWVCVHFICMHNVCMFVSMYGSHIRTYFWFIPQEKILYFYWVWFEHDTKISFKKTNINVGLGLMRYLFVRFMRYSLCKKILYKNLDSKQSSHIKISIMPCC